jgi:acetyl-CoA carboxylase biotin carboxyl carrier protein
MASFSPSDIQTLIGLFDDSEWDELHLEMGDLELFLSKDPAASPPGAPQGAALTDAPAATPSTGAALGAVPDSAPSQIASAETVPDGMVALRAPNLGTFYRAPKPGSPAYVEIGQEVTADTEVCLIEVMKLFTPVRAGIKGIVREVCVDDSDLVEFDQPLFFIEPLD